jgi:LacI family transcriptional regulator
VAKETLSSRLERSAARRAEGRGVTKRRTKRSVGHVKDKPAIRSVADLAGVSVSTVSRVLNGGYASAKVRERVQAAVQELGYSPSTTARSLVTGRTGILGVVAKSTHAPWFTQILAGIEEQLASSHQSVLLGSLALRGRYDSSAVSAWIREHRVDGLVFVRYTRRERGLLQGAVDAGLPVALIGPDLAPKVGFTVRCHNVQAGRLVGEHLLELGHRRIAFAGGPRESIDARDRLQGLRDALSQRGVALEEKNVWFGPSYDPEAGIEYAERLLARSYGAWPTAVVLGNDAMALGFMRTMMQKGWRVPDDLSVVGFDGIPEGALYWPGLTTVVQPTRLMGSVACRALLERIRDRDMDRPSTVKYEVELAVRESTGAPPRRAKRGRQ